MSTLIDRVKAPSTLGPHLREYTHGQVKQLAAVSPCFLGRLGAQAPRLPVTSGTTDESMMFVDIDDTVIEVYSAAKQGVGYGYNKTRGLNALLVTAIATASSLAISVDAVNIVGILVAGDRIDDLGRQTEPLVLRASCEL